MVPYESLAQKWPKMAPSWHQIGFKNRPKMGYPIGLGVVPTWRQTTSKLEPRWGQNTPTQTPKPPKMNARAGYPIAPCDGVPPPLAKKIDFKKGTQQKRGRNLTASPLLSRKSRQHGPKLSSKIDRKYIKNLCKNGLFFDASWG